MDSDLKSIVCPHCGSPYMPRAGWVINSANEFVPTVTCSGCGKEWTTPAKPTVGSDLRTKLEALAESFDLDALDLADYNEARYGDRIDAYRECARRLRALLAEDSNQEDQ